MPRGVPLNHLLCERRLKPLVARSVIDCGFQNAILQAVEELANWHIFWDDDVLRLAKLQAVYIKNQYPQLGDHWPLSRNSGQLPPGLGVVHDLAHLDLISRPKLLRKSAPLLCGEQLWWHAPIAHSVGLIVHAARATQGIWAWRR